MAQNNAVLEFLFFRFIFHDDFQQRIKFSIQQSTDSIVICVN